MVTDISERPNILHEPHRTNPLNSESFAAKLDESLKGLPASIPTGENVAGLGKVKGKSLKRAHTRGVGVNSACMMKANWHVDTSI